MSRHVLICDDDPLLLELATFRLELQGFSVTTVESGQDALDALQRMTPDILVLDSMMPGLDGLQVLSKVRDKPHLAELPVLMLSARQQESHILDALRRGADDYIVKPFIPDELVIRIEKQLRGHAARLSVA